MAEKYDVIDELKQRGLLSQSTDEKQLRELLNDGPITFYCGFDPTAPSIHHGNLVQIIMMKHLQKAGHKPIVVVGGGTGLIGDPRDKAERVLNDEEVVRGWVEKLKKQFTRFFDFDSDEANSPRIINNYEWLGEVSAISLLRDIGKNFRLGTMLAKETVAKRLNSEEGISYTEFSYQILQSYDYLQLFKRYGVRLQTGGNDQWGNLTSGVDLIRKVTGETVHAMTTPLITKADGSKFGKTASGAVWLDPELMSPYAFYQFWVNIADEDVIKLMKVYTFLPLEEIAKIEKEHFEQPHLRLAQKTLAKEVTSFVHGKEAAEKIIEASKVIFSPKGDFRAVDFDILEQATRELPTSKAKVGDGVLTALVNTDLFKSANEVRRAIKEGGVYINNERVTDTDLTLNEDCFLGGKLAIARRGKKNMARIEIE